MVRNIESRDYTERIKPMRVTIGQLTEDYLPHTEKGNKAAEIEVVPRKLVEMIIDYAESETNGVADYAKVLLKTFERD